MQIKEFVAPLFVCSLLLAAGCSTGGGAAAVSTTSTSTTTTMTTTTTAATTIANLQPYADTTGTVATYTGAGVIDLNNHFFLPLGTNGRTCASCHQLNQGMSISAAATQALFTSTAGRDPLFAAVDGANCPTAADGDSAARSLLLSKGLIRVGVTLPSTAEFKLTVTHDPYGCAITTSATGQQTVSIYRRPLPSTGLPYASAVMWDTRETAQLLTMASTCAQNLTTDLTQQMIDAVSGHAQGNTTPTTAQITETLTLMQGFYTAQATDTAAGSLSANGATGGPANFAALLYYPGINDAFGGDPTGAPFNPAAMTLFNSWRNSTNAAQASINRGQGVFNNSPMQITNVRGINDNAALGSPANLRGTCTTCHDAPNVGSHSLPLVMDTGTTRIATSETDPGILAGTARLTASDLPVYQITGCKDATGKAVTYTTTDPGKGLFTGLCADINRVKVPSLRGLAARAPFFHNGSVDNMPQLVNFYNARFQMNLSQAQQTDLVNFLNAL